MIDKMMLIAAAVPFWVWLMMAASLGIVGGRLLGRDETLKQIARDYRQMGRIAKSPEDIPHLAEQYLFRIYDKVAQPLGSLPNPNLR